MDLDHWDKLVTHDIMGVRHTNLRSIMAYQCSSVKQGTSLRQLTYIIPRTVPIEAPHNSTSSLFSSDSLIYLWSASTLIGQSLKATSTPPHRLHGSIIAAETFVNF